MDVLRCHNVNGVLEARAEDTQTLKKKATPLCREAALDASLIEIKMVVSVF